MRLGKKAAVIAAVTLGCGALWGPALAHAAPANDNFADRIELSGTLPIEATGSNVEATKESGEPSGSPLEPAGHSVWFEWEAEATEWITVATCGSDFDTLLDVYTGDAFFNLAKVAPWHEGPWFDCDSSGSQVTFRAVDGTSYPIRVDGDFSPQPPSALEGPIALSIASTPVPANDDFADAQVVTAESLEAGTFFRVDVPGFNWNATKETGEPVHEGDQGGGSVWYSWTAPASGEATARVASAGLEPRLGVYTGDSFDSLAPTGTPFLSPGGFDFAAVAGTTYRFAVDGQFDASSVMASMGQFTFLVYLEVPPVAASSSLTPPAPIDGTAPETIIVKRSIKPGRHRAAIAFRSSEAAGSFRCKLDRRKEASCRSPKTYTGLAAGSHTFRVYAVDALGNADSTPAVARFAIPRRSRRG